MKFFIGTLLLIIAFICIITTRLMNVDATEGELFINYWGIWVLSISLATSGAILVNEE